MDKSIKVEDIDSMWNSTRTKMTELENKVKSLKLKMDELREKYSQPEPKINGSDLSDVPLVSRDERQIPSHRVIISSNSPVLPQQKTVNLVPNQSDVSLACGDETNVSAHSNNLSSNRSMFAVMKKDIDKECADVTLVCGNNKKVYAHQFILSSNSFEKKEIEKQYTNVTLAPDDGKYQPRNQKDRMYLFQSSGDCQCAGGEFLEQNPVALPPWPTLQEGGIARHHKDQYSRGQVWGECYYERGGNHSNKKSEQFVRFVFLC